MPPPAPARSSLFSTSPELTLRGARCAVCGYVFFPPQAYGCEVCGARDDQLEPTALRGEGVLSSFATVHLHQGKGIEAPFTVGVIVLDEGPPIRALLTQRTDEGLKIGDRMRAVLVTAGDDESGSPVSEVRFAKQENVR